MSESTYDRWMKSLDIIEAEVRRAIWHIRILYAVIGVLMGLLLRAWGIT
jgi:hypothetical protein